MMEQYMILKTVGGTMSKNEQKLKQYLNKIKSTKDDKKSHNKKSV